MNGRPLLPHRDPIDDIIAGHLVTPPFPCFREPFRQLQLHHGSFTDVTPIAYFLVIIQFSRLHSRTTYFSDSTVNNRSVYALPSGHSHLWIDRIRHCTFNHFAISILMEFSKSWLVPFNIKYIIQICPC